MVEQNDQFCTKINKKAKELDVEIAKRLNPYLKYQELDSIKAFVLFFSNEGRDLLLQKIDQ